MSRKQFIAIAAAIRQITDKADRERVARLLVDVCKAANAAFDAGRFYTACDAEQR